MDTEITPVTATQEKYFLNTFPLIQLLLLQKLTDFYAEFAEDLKQKVALNLWKWKLRRPEKNLTEEEWLKLSNTSTCNEIKHLYSSRIHQAVSLSETSEAETAENKIALLQTPSPAGNTKTEAASLARQMWKLIKKQTLREKYALLLKDRQLINYLRIYNCCGIKEIAATLELNDDDFLQLYRLMPFSDEKIGFWLSKKLQKEITEDQVNKARHRIRTKLKQFQMRAKENPPDERTFVAGKTKNVSPGSTQSRRGG